MRAGIGGALVKANPGDEAILARGELHAQFGCTPVAAVHNLRCRRGTPHVGLTLYSHADARPRGFKVPAIIDGTALDSGRARAIGPPNEAPVPASGGGLPYVSAVERNFYAGHHTAAGVDRCADNRHQGTNLHGGTRRGRSDARSRGSLVG